MSRGTPVACPRSLQAGHDPQISRATATTGGTIIDGVVERGECEFVTEVASDLPLRVICETLNSEERTTRYGEKWKISNLHALLTKIRAGTHKPD